MARWAPTSNSGWSAAIRAARSNERPTASSEVAVTIPSTCPRSTARHTPSVNPKSSADTTNIARRKGLTGLRPDPPIDIARRKGLTGLRPDPPIDIARRKGLTGLRPGCFIDAVTSSSTPSHPGGRRIGRRQRPQFRAQPNHLTEHGPDHRERRQGGHPAGPREVVDTDLQDGEPGLLRPDDQLGVDE